jgi:hypothetical protein
LLLLFLHYDYKNKKQEEGAQASWAQAEWDFSLKN